MHCLILQWKIFTVFGWGYNLPWQQLWLVIFPNEWKHRYKQVLPPHLSLQSGCYCTSAQFYTGNTIAGAELQAPVYTHQREAHLLKCICLCAKHWRNCHSNDTFPRAYINITMSLLQRRKLVKIHHFRSQQWNKTDRGIHKLLLFKTTSASPF